MTAGDAMIDAIAEAVASRLERMNTTRQRLLTVDKAAEYLGASEDTVERLVGSGKLAAVRVDRRLRIDVRDLDRLVDASKTSPK